MSTSSFVPVGFLFSLPPPHCHTLCMIFNQLEREKKGVEERMSTGGVMRERSDDITGGLTCVRVQVHTSSVTGRGRASILYVGHIKNTCSYQKFSQLTKQQWKHRCAFTPHQLPVTVEMEIIPTVESVNCYLCCRSLKLQHRPRYQPAQFLMSLGNYIMRSVIFT